MILLPKANVLSLNAVFCALCIFTVTSSTLPLRGQQPDVTAPAGWHSDEAVHLIGLPDIREKKKGSLSISSEDLIFTSPEGRASVSRSEISSVTVGDVRVETGGTTGKITRAIIPFGGGSALATVSNKQVSLLTIEFRDERAALHGVVAENIPNCFIPAFLNSWTDRSMQTRLARRSFLPSRHLFGPS